MHACMHAGMHVSMYASMQLAGLAGAGRAVRPDGGPRAEGGGAEGSPAGRWEFQDLKGPAKGLL